MAKQVQQRRGTTSEHSTFTGAVGELTVDTDKDTVVVHDGATAGGFPVAKESNVPNGSNSAITDDGTNINIAGNINGVDADTLATTQNILDNDVVAMYTGGNLDNANNSSLFPQNRTLVYDPLSGLDINGNYAVPFAGIYMVSVSATSFVKVDSRALMVSHGNKEVLDITVDPQSADFTFSYTVKLNAGDTFTGVAIYSANYEYTATVDVTYSLIKKT